MSTISEVLAPPTFNGGSQCGARTGINAGSSASQACEAQAPVPRAGLGNTTSSRIGDNTPFMTSVTKAVKNDQITRTKNLPLFLEGGKVSFAPGGKIIIDGINLKLPDYDSEIKREYQRGLEEIGKAACMQKATDKGFGYITTIAIWVVIVILLVALVWYFFSSRNSSA